MTATWWVLIPADKGNVSRETRSSQSPRSSLEPIDRGSCDDGTIAVTVMR